MRKIIVGAFVTLDGVMQSPGGPTEDTSGDFRHGGWLVPHFDDDVGAAMGVLMAEPFDLLLGRRTYDIFAGYWPKQKGDPTSEQFDRITKYVATRDAGFTPEWQNTEVLGADVVTTLTALKEQQGPNLLTQGSSGLLRTLFSSNLVDEITVLIFPVILGYGKRLFGDGVTPTGLKLINSKTSASGVTVNRYARTGGVASGSF